MPRGSVPLASSQALCSPFLGQLALGRAPQPKLSLTYSGSTRSQSSSSTQALARRFWVNSLSVELVSPVLRSPIVGQLALSPARQPGLRSRTLGQLAPGRAGLKIFLRTFSAKMRKLFSLHLWPTNFNFLFSAPSAQKCFFSQPSVRNANFICFMPLVQEC